MTVHSITASNLNNALHDALWWLKTAGVEEPSRNGAVLVAPGPVITTYLMPEQRVMFSRRRAANPFFHLFESLWMLGGRNDVAFPRRYAEQIAEYSDDGVTFHSAYGNRWRHHFGFDQIVGVVAELAATPTSRRAVINMWDPRTDLSLGLATMKDVPCNTAAYFDLRGGVLNMTITNRSNDAIWGCYGANAVHMSMLQGYIARWLGVDVGVYQQFSNNFHIYVEREDTQRLMKRSGPGDYNVLYTPEDCYRDLPQVLNSPLDGCTTPEWGEDLELFLAEPLTDVEEYQTQAFETIIGPLSKSHQAYKDGKATASLEWADLCDAQDWRHAAIDWVRTRPSMRKVLGTEERL